MTLADQIRLEAAKEPNRKPSEIAKLFGCKPEYVRVVLRQRVKGDLSIADRTYYSTPKGIATRKAHNAARRAYRASLSATADLDTIRKAQKLEYMQARREGLKKREASARAWALRSELIRKSGCVEKAKQAAEIAREQCRQKIITATERYHDEPAPALT